MVNAKALMAVFIAGVMIFSIFGYIIEETLRQPSNEVNYNGFNFRASQNGYATEVNKKRLIFNFLPDHLDEVFIPNEVKGVLNQTKALIVTYDPSVNETEVLGLAQFMFEEQLQPINDRLFLQRALTNASNTELAEASCVNATETVPVIFFEPSNKTEIFIDNHCVHLNFDSPLSLIQQSEKIRYILLGVIK